MKSMKKIKIAVVIGTRPEVIKMAPVIKEFEKRDRVFDTKVIVTGQHIEMCKPYLELFNISSDYNLRIMEKNQTLNSIVRNILNNMPKILEEEKPDYIMVQGDTTSAFAAALCGFHAKIKIGHVEAGLRTYNKYNPFPEEINRSLIGKLADIHFAPTDKACENLKDEGIDENKIFVTGNTGIDSLLRIVRQKYKFKEKIINDINLKENKIICVTTHRRENFGESLKNILNAVIEITKSYDNIHIIIPVHYNPNVREAVLMMLKDKERIHIIEPLPYEIFVQLLNKSYIILTDSGGIQEEAPSLGKPVLVLRETTERPEGVAAGTAKIVGSNQKNIVAAVKELIEHEDAYQKMAMTSNPYGDGKAAFRIAEIIEGQRRF